MSASISLSRFSCPDPLPELPPDSQTASCRPRIHSLPALAAVLACVLFAGPAAVGQFLDSTSPPAPDEASPAPALPANIPRELRLGADYLVGDGVPRDPVQSAFWYRRAADHGDPGAQNQLGYLYIWGIGVDSNPAEAARWFLRAAGSGLPQAKLNLAVIYLRGRGVARDPVLAVDLLNQLAQKGNCRAQDYLGILYYSGTEVPQDRSLAEKWFSKSAAAKCPDGEYSMGRLDSTAAGHPRDLALAVKYFRHSAKAGYVPSMHALALLLLQHPEIAQHSDEALTLLERSAEAGTWRSSEALAILARDGARGTPPDGAAAYRWFTIAGRQGGPNAEQQVHPDLVRARQLLTPEQQQQQEQEAAAWLARHPNFDLFVEGGRGRGTFPDAEVFAGPPRPDPGSPAPSPGPMAEP